MKRFFFFLILFSFFIFSQKIVFGQNKAGCCEVSNESGIQCLLVSSEEECLKNYANINPKYFANYICDDLRSYKCIPTSSSENKEDKFYFQVPFPGSEEIENASADVRMLEYLVLIFRLGVWFAVFLAIFMIMVAGFLYLTAGGSSERVGRAKEYIGGALSGLVIALFSFVILQTINPRLVELSFPEIPVPDLSSGTGNTCCWDKVSNRVRDKITLLQGETCSSLNSILSGDWVLCSEMKSCLCDRNSGGKYRTCYDPILNTTGREINGENCDKGYFGVKPCELLDGPCVLHRESGILLPPPKNNYPDIPPVF